MREGSTCLLESRIKSTGQRLEKIAQNTTTWTLYVGDLEPGEGSITGGFLKRAILKPPPGLEDGDAVARFRWQVRSIDEGFDYSKLVGT